LHIADEYLDVDKKLDQRKIDLVARLGADWYCRVSPDNLFQVAKPNIQLGIGFDALPASVRNSKILSGNQLGQLANVHEMPVVEPSYEDAHLKNIIQYYSINPVELEKEIHLHAAKLLDQGKVHDAWQVLLADASVI
ncbi:MAG TPA: flavin reductase family protein, partial [Chitinophagaceae bacterium]